MKGARAVQRKEAFTRVAYSAAVKALMIAREEQSARRAMRATAAASMAMIRCFAAQMLRAA